ncbi:helix-turn-helix transcriptional regulator [Sporosarcina limicola]|uniref:DNA-binding transcriptional regulator YafY n=1 Tax=Sporosarcina limicola TaxID=34101 RepID=A0A927MHE4_9BACL|nr:WYL domain-containing protein [Sporosarcina limicola]MBE1553821.1 putative DNA-binding transcriptional regulator YafY [Sporosarcina limicola]
MAKFDNLLAILWLLKARKRITAKQISDDLEIHIRTVYRYIDALCASGVPIVAESGHNGGYTLNKQFNEAHLFFSTKEQNALIHASKFAQKAGYPYSEDLQDAVDKLKRYTNEEQLNEINKHSSGLDVLNTPPDPKLNPILKEAESCIAEGYTLNIEYQTGYSTSKSIRNIDPFGLVYWIGKWYIVAFCHDRQEIRTFRADRIRQFYRTSEIFTRPTGFSARRFLLERLLPEQDNLLSIHIKGTPQVICDLCGHWLLGHTIAERSMEYVHLKINESAVLTYVPYFILQYGKSIHIIEPTLLKERLVEVTNELSAFYQQTLHEFQ